ncbi:hypothetical protein Sliba_06100 [Streptomyces nigrescens]|uniref:Uncharacterized protein n=1 Tax=Streptomyces nigrescens TaxID=1920 RepID=A0A640T8S7_STRNI|nr:hypothetical protein Sliba_06100 [Streptomyces libani subsp. libani]GGV86000.1 hypothetical protein GCM10010500_03540 [Streptomyces libani subsp. libani]
MDALQVMCRRIGGQLPGRLVVPVVPDGEMHLELPHESRPAGRFRPASGHCRPATRSHPEMITQHPAAVPWRRPPGRFR